MILFTVYADQGETLGIYPGASEAEACEACAQDAGYKSIADMEKRLECDSFLRAVPYADTPSRDDTLRDACERLCDEYERRVRDLESAGLTRSDAQAAVDAELLKNDRRRSH